MFTASYAGKNRHALAHAVFNTLQEPVLVLDGELRVIATNQFYADAFRAKADDTEGNPMSEINDGQWDIPELQDLLKKVAPEGAAIDDYEVKLDIPTVGVRTMLLNARKLYDGRRSSKNTLVTLTDVTKRRSVERERDDLLRQKEILLQEMQHRISNSLQIIASILLMKARNVISAESRGHLEDAHTRVLAVAAAQRHLRVCAEAATVELEPYFVQLCASLAGAMIRAECVKLRVEIAHARVPSGAAVSLGLIITEVMINALKHAFPTDKPENAIVVSYVVDGADWTLSISDNGVGMASRSEKPTRIGLGTSIVSALAEQLDARVSTITGAAGTKVSIIHAVSASA